MAIEGIELELAEAEELESPFKRRVALGIVLVTLFGSVVAYLAATASVREDRLGRDAQRAAITALGTGVVSTEENSAAYGVWAEAQQYDRRRVIAAGRARILPSGSAQEKLFLDEVGRWQAVIDVLRPLSPLLDDSSPFGSELDTNFPGRFEAENGIKAEIDALGQAALAESSNAWSAKASRFEAIITLLAVVLFLLGLSLTLGGRSRFVFVVPAVLILTWAAVSTAREQSQGTPSTPEQAVRAVAEGFASAQQGDFDGAIASYTRAIALRSDYAVAYTRRADVYFLRGTPQRSSDFVSITNPDDLKRAISDREQALRYGGDRDLATVGAIGFESFLAGRYRDSEKYSKRAIELNKVVPELWFNLALAKVALGNPDGADPAYIEAIRLTNLRPRERERTQLFAAARTDLEILRRARPDRERDVIRFQEAMVVGETEKILGEAPTGRLPEGATFSNFTFEVLGSSITANFDYENVPQGTPLAFIYYLRPDDNTPWAQEPVLSSIETHQLDESGGARIVRSLSLCPTPGDYRLDIFADGGFGGTGAFTFPPGPYGPTEEYENEVLGFRVCRPEGWTTDEEGVDDTVLFANPADTIAYGVGSFPVPRDVSVDDSSRLERTVLDASADGKRRTVDYKPYSFGGVDGQSAEYDAGRGSILFTAAALGDDRIMRTILIIAPASELANVQSLLDTLRFDF